MAVKIGRPARWLAPDARPVSPASPADRGAAPWYARKFRAPKLVIVGDSNTQYNNYAISAGTTLYNRVYEPHEVAKRLKPRWRGEVFINPSDTRGTRYFTGYNYGVGGQTIAQIKTRVVDLGEPWACNSDIVGLLAGTNDMNTPTELASAKASLDAILEECYRRRKPVVLGKVPPRGTATTICTDSATSYIAAGADGWTFRDQFNEYIVSLCSATGPVRLWDTDVILDPDPPSGQVGEVLPYRTRDGTHFSALGAEELAVSLNAVLDTWIYDDPAYDLDFASAANLYTNGTLSGTSGSVSGGITNNGGSGGGVATSHQVTRGGSNFGVSVNATKGSEGEQVLTFTSTNPSSPNAQEVTLFGLTTFAVNRGSLVDGQWVQGIIDVEASAWDHWKSVRAYFRSRTSAPANIYIEDGNVEGNTTTPDKIWSAGGRFRIITPPLLVTAALATIQTYVNITYDSAGASGSGTLKFRGYSVKVCADPTVEFVSGPIS